MAKIEELTLYANDQQKTILAQQTQIEALTNTIGQLQALEKQVAELKARMEKNEQKK